MEIMGEPNKDFNEAIKYIRDVAQKRVDEAYKKGVNDGSLDIKIRIEGAYQKGLSDAWEAAKKIVLSTDEGGLSVHDLFKIFGNDASRYALKNYSVSEAIKKIKEYEEEKDRDVCRGCVWEGRYDGDCAMCSNNYRELYRAKENDNEIKVGDEVESLYDDGTVIENTIPWVVTWIREGYNRKKYHYGIDAEGTLRHNELVRKTGRHFGIDKILEEMRE